MMSFPIYLNHTILFFFHFCCCWFVCCFLLQPFLGSSFLNPFWGLHAAFLLHSFFFKIFSPLLVFPFAWVFYCISFYRKKKKLFFCFCFFYSRLSAFCVGENWPVDAFSLFFLFVHGPTMDFFKKLFSLSLHFSLLFKTCAIEVKFFVWRFRLHTRVHLLFFLYFCSRLFRAMRWRRNKFRRVTWVRPPLLPITRLRRTRRPVPTEPQQPPNLQQWPPTLPSLQSELCLVFFKFERQF